MCKALVKRMNEMRSKTLHGRFEDKVEKDYGIRPYGMKMVNKAVGIDDPNMFYQKGGRGFVEAPKRTAPSRAIPTNRTGG
jgi:hypothetical protein